MTAAFFSVEDIMKSDERVETAASQNGSSRVMTTSSKTKFPKTTVSIGGDSAPPPSSGPPSVFSDDLPRLVSRNLTFHQSKNKVRVTHNKGWGIFSLLRHDWFHVFLRQPTWMSGTFLIALWTFMILFFAAVYVGIDRKDPNVSCGLGAAGDPISFGAAFAFSLETCTTVGYGLPNGVNSFFETKCGYLQTVIYFQMVWSMMFNAFLFAFFYNRLGRCEARGAQVVMANKALVNVSPTTGQVRFQLRIFDVDAKHPVVEAHVRLYAVDKHRPVPRPLRVLQPDDDYGSVLFLSLPTVVTHHIDVFSMLHPPVETPVAAQGLDLREADSATNGRDLVVCPICGESFGTHERWVKHVRYNQIVEAKDDYPVEGTHLSLTEADLKPPPYPIRDLDELKEFFQTEVSEIICVVEGIDPLMSGTFQALQSYKFEDIVWDENANYAPCLQVRGLNLSVDLDRFHEIEFLPPPLHPTNDRSLRKHDSLYDENGNVANDDSL